MELTAKSRRQIKGSNFALPGRRYPIHDASHARNALARVAQHGSPQEQAAVRAAVARRYPNMGESLREAIRLAKWETRRRTKPLGPDDTIEHTLGELRDAGSRRTSDGRPTRLARHYRRLKSTITSGVRVRGDELEPIGSPHVKYPHLTVANSAPWYDEPQRAKYGPSSPTLINQSAAKAAAENSALRKASGGKGTYHSTGRGGIGAPHRSGKLFKRLLRNTQDALRNVAGGDKVRRVIMKNSTDEVWANLMEGIWGRIKGAAAGLRDKFRDKVLDKYVAPAAHASVKFPGAEPHDSVTQGRITRMYRALGGKGMSPTLVRHKGNTGMAYMKVPVIGAPDGKLPVIAAPARGTRVVGQLRRGKGVVAGFHNSSGITHEVGHAALTSKGDISHKRMPMVDALNKRHPKNVFGEIAKLDPKTYATQTRLHMRAEGRNNTFLGTSKNRLRAAKKSMTAAARSLYDDVKKHAPDEASRFVQRYKNFRRAWRKGSPTAHLKLSADSARQNLREVEYLPGGRAEGKPSRAFPPKQLRMGRKVEMEHTRNPRVAEEIAKDHLAEFNDYYTRLARMERMAKRAKVKGAR